MDASRLLAVVADIDSDFRGGLSQLLKELVQQYTAARDSPTQDNTAAIKKALVSLSEHVNEGVFVAYPPSKAAVLAAIGGETRVGQGFSEHLKNILSVTGQTTAGIVTGLTQLQTEAEAFRKACLQTKAGLESLGIRPYAIRDGQFEVGVLIPERLVDQKLGALAKELEAWNRTLRGFQEVAGDEEREVTVASLASGSYEAYLPLGLVAAGLVSKTIDKVLEWYLRILEIRKKRIELQELGAPVAEPNAIKKHERDLLEKEITTLAEQLVKQVHPKVDAPRRHELETHLTISIRQVARFVDNGGTVEVDATIEAPEEPEAIDAADATDEAKAEHDRATKEYARLAQSYERALEILASGSALRGLPERPEPILQLTDGDLGAEAAPDQDKAKKKG
jgi:hypothetical protein